MKKHLFVLSLLLLAVIAGSSACAPQVPADGDEPVSSEDTVEPTDTLDETEFELGENAIVESVEVIFLESFPLQAHAVVSGQLPDGCTTVRSTESEKVNSTFEVRIYTQRPKDKVCTQALVPFGENIPLDIYGLEAGTFEVDAYGETANFSLEQDNILEEPSG